MKTKVEQFLTNKQNPALSVTKDGVVLYSNKAGESLLNEWGIRVGEKVPYIIGDSIRRMISRNSPEKIEVAVGKKVFSVIFHPLPKLKLVFISGFDISDKRELEMSLLESERRLYEAQKIANIGNWDHSFTDDKLYWSDELYRIYSRNPRETITYAEFFNYIHPDDQAYVTKAIRGSLEGKHYGGIDYRIILANGEERIVHSNSEVVFDDNNSPIRMKGTTQDITDRKKAEEKIQILANIVESSNDAIGTLSLDGIITSWNKGGEHVYGYSAEEILGEPASSVAPHHLSEETLRLGELVEQGKKIHNYETKRIRKDGRVIDVSITFSPVFDMRGKLIAISFISRDISENKKAEEKLCQEKKNAEVANRAKSDFLANMSHELRTP